MAIRIPVLFSSADDGSVAYRLMAWLNHKVLGRWRWAYITPRRWGAWVVIVRY